MHERIKNYHIAVQETNERILFLRKLSKGASEHSFGIHVAKMAGVPQLVSKRASEILTELERQRKSIGDTSVSGAAKAAPIQLSMFQLSDPAFDKIKTDLQTMDLNTLTPIEALMKLNEWRKMLKY